MSRSWATRCASVAWIPAAGPPQARSLEDSSECGGKRPNRESRMPVPMPTACQAATIKVAPTNPNSPMIEVVRAA